jgi:hypothetical protein
MIIIMIVLGYLIVGAILACKEREIIDDVYDELLGEHSIAKHKGFMIIFAIVIMLMLPTHEIQLRIKDIKDELKWMKTKRAIRKDLIEAKKKLDTMQAKLDDKK